LKFTAILVLTASILSACGFARGGPELPTTIAGNLLGPEISCESSDQACEDRLASGITAARASLDKTLPGHLGVTSVHTFPLADQPRTSGGIWFYVLLTLEDGVVSPVLIDCGVGISDPRTCQSMPGTP
jgi:hypothetical protein